MKSFIRRSDLSRDRAEQRPERFGVGDKIDVRVTNIDSKTRVWVCRSRHAKSQKKKKRLSSMARATLVHPWVISLVQL